MAANDIKLGSNFRLFVGTAADADADNLFNLVENENDLTLSIKVDSDKVNTKSGGKVTVAGDVEYSVKATINEIYVDTGLSHLIGALNKAWPYQIRDVVNDKVWVEGTFVLTDIEYKSGSKGVREIGVTLEAGGAVTVDNTGGRAVVVTP